MDCFSQACKDFGLAISLKKTHVLGQETEAPPVITIDDYELDALCQFTYLGSTITDNLSLDADDWEGSFNSRSSHSSSVDKPQAVCEDKDDGLQCLCYQHIAVWQRDMDYIWREGQKAQNIPLEKHPPYPGHILAGWQDKVTNADVLSRAGLPSRHTLFRQRRLRWLCHIRCMEDGRIPKDILYGELALGRRTTGRPHLRCKDVCIRDIRRLSTSTLCPERALQLIAQSGEVP